MNRGGMLPSNVRNHEEQTMSDGFIQRDDTIRLQADGFEDVYATGGSFSYPVEVGKVTKDSQFCDVSTVLLDCAKPLNLLAPDNLGRKAAKLKALRDS